MKNTNKTRDKIFLLVEFMKHFQNDTANRMEETVKKGTVKAIFITAGGAKLSMTAESNKFKFTAMRVSVHGTTKGRIPTINSERIIVLNPKDGL